MRLDRLRLRAAGRAHRPGADRTARRGAPAGRPGQRGARAPPRPRPARRCCGDGDLLVVNDTKVIPARLRLHRETGGAAEVLLLEPLDDDRRTWEALVRPARKLRVGEQLLDAGGEPLVEIGGRTRGRRHVRPSTLARRRRSAGAAADATARCRCRRTSASPWPSPTATRPSTPPSPARPRRRPPGCTSRPSCSTRIAAHGVEVATVELVVGLDTFKPVSRRRPAAARDAQRALPRRRRRAGAVPAGAAGGRRRHDERCAPWNRRPRSGELQRPHPAVHHTGRTTGRWST